jgi:hypothetical protein
VQQNEKKIPIFFSQIRETKKFHLEEKNFRRKKNLSKPSSLSILTTSFLRHNIWKKPICETYEDTYIHTYLDHHGSKSISSRYTFNTGIEVSNL